MHVDDGIEIRDMANGIGTVCAGHWCGITEDVDGLICVGYSCFNLIVVRHGPLGY